MLGRWLVFRHLPNHETNSAAHWHWITPRDWVNPTIDCIQDETVLAPERCQDPMTGKKATPTYPAIHGSSFAIVGAQRAGEERSEQKQHNEPDCSVSNGEHQPQ